MKLYGIKNCDSVKKARRFLEANRVDYEFIDLKTVALEDSQLTGWLQNPKLINTRGTTYRQLKEQVQSCSNQAELIELIQANPMLIKRPVIELNDTILVGFDEDEYSDKLCN